ncbi:MAG: NAD(P)H-dependent oxidoreductase subunit E [bacterium]|nr:NAD(P)H-dependent oxidoreductase subunit E [bacterium]
MSSHFKLPDPPTDDKRWNAVQAVMRLHGRSEHALIESLHAVQHAQGYLDRTALAYVAKSLNLPLSKVYGVATFYQFFTLKPPGKHSCVLCTGTACYIKGAPALLKAMQERYGIGLEETTADGEFTLQSACCVGTCGLAPIAAIDGVDVGPLTKEKLLAKLDDVLHGHS